MPALGFQKQFVMPILTGVKTSTIRAPRKDGRAHCKAGDTLKLYYGMRTKQCEMISEVRCTNVTPIRLNGIYGRDYDRAPAEIKPVIMATARLAQSAADASAKKKKNTNDQT